MTEPEKNKVNRARLTYLMIAGGAGIILLVLGIYQLLNFTDTTGFCARLCHSVMYPESTAHQASPHADVTCAACHVGPGLGNLAKSKINGLSELFSQVTNSYDKPIKTPVANLPAAGGTCLNCHNPESYNGDVASVTTTYQQDQANTPTTSTTILNIGGGQAGTAQGIHWHATAQVWYLASDTTRNDIIWVGVVDKQGNLTEYYDESQKTPVSQALINQKARLMDCTDCHNRTGHDFTTPETLIDSAMSQGLIDPGIPYIKKEAMAVLGTSAVSLDAANAKIDALRSFYSANYPQYAAQNAAKIDAAVARLKDIAQLTTFPDMNVTWNTYLNNDQHSEGEGCFRCHGKLIRTTPGTGQGLTLSDDCNQCHTFQNGGIAQNP